MKKIKLVYNLIGRYGPANNCLPIDDKTLEHVDKNSFFFPANSYFPDIIDHLRHQDLFEVCTPYNLNLGDNFLYEVPWDIRFHGEELFRQMTDMVYKGIINGNGYLLVNDAVDPLEIHRVEELLVITDAKNIPRNKIIFLTGAIDVDNLDVDWGIKIIVADWNEMVLSMNCQMIGDITDSTLPKLNKFICLNRMWQHHRVHLLWQLWKKDLLKHFAISFQKSDPNTAESYIKRLPEMAFDFFTEEERTNIEQDAAEIDKLLPLVVDDTTKLKVHHSHSYLQEHTQYYFNLVPETTFYNWRKTYFKGVHASEKVFKPILYKMPFIVMGPAGVLRALRRRGYETFNSIIDESYDEIENDSERFARILELIEEIGNKDTTELDSMIRRVDKITKFNFDRLRVRGNFAREELIEKFLNIFGT